MSARPIRTAQAPSPVDDGPSDPTRREFLDRNASSMGLDWAVAIRSALRQQGRPAAGGFPGTMSEVRAHLGLLLGAALRDARMAALLPNERDWSARIAYAAARKDWLAHGERADEDEEED
ncbi:MAG: hypothetical protein U0230_00900 [Polyangiales bacterium]